MKVNFTEERIYFEEDKRRSEDFAPRISVREHTNIFNSCISLIIALWSFSDGQNEVAIKITLCLLSFERKLTILLTCKKRITMFMQYNIITTVLLMLESLKMTKSADKKSPKIYWIDPWQNSANKINKLFCEKN